MWGGTGQSQDAGTELAKKLQASMATGWQQDYGGSQQKAYDDQQAWNAAHPDRFLGIVGNPTPAAAAGPAGPAGPAAPTPGAATGGTGAGIAGVGGGGSDLGGTPPEMSDTSASLQGLQAAAGGGGGGMTQNLSPTGLRPGLGTRILPQYSASLAGLRSAY